MDAESVRKEITGFIGLNPRGRDILDIRKYLGSPPWHELVNLLDEMAAEGVLKKKEERVEGNRMATFYTPGSKMPPAINASDFPKGRRKSWSRTKQPA